MQLYASEHFRLIGVRVSGKKKVAGVLCFKGLPSAIGAPNEILAARGGVVVDAGRVLDSSIRMSRCGTHVTIRLPDGVTMTYGRLASRIVKVGDRIREGDKIGMEGDSGSGKGYYLTVELRRNDRRIDGLNYLGITDDQREFFPEDECPSEIVSRICGFSEPIKRHIDSFPDAGKVWKSLLDHMIPTGDGKPA